MDLETRAKIGSLLQDIKASAERIRSLDGKDVDVCDEVQDILVEVEAIEYLIM